jgi:hypothetical protein
MAAEYAELPPDAHTEQLLQRYSAIRARHALPLLEIERLVRITRVRVSALPPQLDVELASRLLLERVLTWLVRVERDWGSSLAVTLVSEELRYDAARRQCALGMGLFTQGTGPTLLEAIARRLERWPLPVGVDSFEGLLASAGIAHTWTSAEHHVRALLELARRQQQARVFADATRTALKVWEIRPGDLDAGVLALSSFRRSKESQELREELLPIVKQLSVLPAPPWEICLELGSFWELTNPSVASAWADQAISLSPREQRCWRLAARVRQRCGQQSAALDAIEELARLGDSTALGILVKHVPERRWHRVAVEWSGEMTPAVLRIQLQALAAEARWRMLLRRVQQHIDLLEGLPVDVTEEIYTATHQVPGSDTRIRELLRSLISAPNPPPGLSILYARLCLDARQYEEVLLLVTREPDLLPRAIWLKALAAGEHWSDFLKATHPEELPVLQLRAHIALSLIGSSSIHPRALRNCVAALQTDEEWEQAAELAEYLRSAAPGQPITATLGALLQQR